MILINNILMKYDGPYTETKRAERRRTVLTQIIRDGGKPKVTMADGSTAIHYREIGITSCC